ncbi:uncharacterized protein LOC111070736 [Drosophila obscura]|uniref:uncharacterized protein LOC111070736 n=1 Tax=Drosophila obscura TaxID=7282 RepID=UPI001BB1CA4C|nr:uncharacterized protein LOC111070736 [Drosophila obscura]
MEVFIENRQRNAINATIFIDRVQVVVRNLLIYLWTYIFLKLLRFRVWVQLRLCMRYFRRLTAKLSYYHHRNRELPLKYIEQLDKINDIMAMLMLKDMDIDDLGRFPRLDVPLHIYQDYLLIKQEVMEIEMKLLKVYVERLREGPEEEEFEWQEEIDSGSGSDSDSDDYSDNTDSDFFDFTDDDMDR